MTAKTQINANVAGVPADHLHLLDPAVVREIATQTISIHRQLAGELVGMTDDQATDRMAALLAGAQLASPDLVARLASAPLR